MPVDTIRELPFGTGLILLRSAPPIIARLTQWTERPDAAQLRADRTAVEAALQKPPAPGTERAPAS